MSTFAFGASSFWAFAVGCSSAFKVGTAFCRSPFLATVAQVPLTGSTETAVVVVLLVSGALRRGFAGRGGHSAFDAAFGCGVDFGADIGAAFSDSFDAVGGDFDNSPIPRGTEGG